MQISNDYQEYFLKIFIERPYYHDRINHKDTIIRTLLKKEAELLNSKCWKQLSVGGLLLGGICFWGINDDLEMTACQLQTSKITGSIRFLYLSDLHGSRYGDHQVNLIKAVESAEPDIVALGGDIFDGRFDVQASLDLVRGLVNDYPIFYVAGNHEFQHAPANSVKEWLRSQGVAVLEGQAIDLDVRGNPLTILGVDDPYAGLESYAKQVAQLAPSENYTVLLSHRPERINDFQHVQPDLVLSGHAHGGQWRIPFINQGVYAPHQGIWPKYTSGQHYFGQTVLIVSRGLTTDNTVIPRLFNRPELLVIDIIGK